MMYLEEKEEEPECNPDNNGRDSDSSNDENDLEDYNDGEVVTDDKPEDNQN